MSLDNSLTDRSFIDIDNGFWFYLQAHWTGDWTANRRELNMETGEADVPTCFPNGT